MIFIPIKELCQCLRSASPAAGSIRGSSANTADTATPRLKLTPQISIKNKNREDIKDFEKEIEEKEKLRTGKKKEFYLKMNETLKLKDDLTKEINELEKLFKNIFIEKTGKYVDPIYLKKFDFGEKEIKIELNSKINKNKYINFDPEKINSIHQMPDYNPFLFNMK